MFRLPLILQASFPFVLIHVIFSSFVSSAFTPPTGAYKSFASHSSVVDSGTLLSFADPSPLATIQKQSTSVEPDSELVRIPLTNVMTGETFTLEDFAGKTVIVETIATWCAACRGHLQRTQRAIEQLTAPNDYVIVALSMEANLTDHQLQKYADRNDLNRSNAVFSIASMDILLAMRTRFGRAVLNPPATPHFFISPTGEVSNLSVGSTSVNQLMEKLEEIHGE